MRGEKNSAAPKRAVSRRNHPSGPTRSGTSDGRQGRAGLDEGEVQADAQRRGAPGDLDRIGGGGRPPPSGSRR